MSSWKKLDWIFLPKMAKAESSVKIPAVLCNVEKLVGLFLLIQVDKSALYKNSSPHTYALMICPGAAQRTWHEAKGKTTMQLQYASERSCWMSNGPCAKPGLSNLACTPTPHRAPENNSARDSRWQEGLVSGLDKKTHWKQDKQLRLTSRYQELNVTRGWSDPRCVRTEKRLQSGGKPEIAAILSILSCDAFGKNCDKSFLREIWNATNICLTQTKKQNTF